MASKIEEFLRKFRGGQFQEQNVISGEVIPRNIISGRISERPLAPTPGPIRTGRLPGRDIATTPIDELTAGEFAEFDKLFGGTTTPGRGLERRFPLPTGRQRTTGELLAEEGTPTAPGFDWARFIETAGTLGAALAPQGVLAKAGLAAAGLVKEERKRGVKAATAAEDLRRFEITTKLAEVDNRLAQAKHDYNIKQDAESLEKLLTIEREKSRLRIEEETAKLPAREAKVKKVEDRKRKIETRQVERRVHKLRSRALDNLKKHIDLTTTITELAGLNESQLKQIEDAIRNMELTGDEFEGDIIQMAIDFVGTQTSVSSHAEVSARELLGPDEEEADFITNEELLRGVK